MGPTPSTNRFGGPFWTTHNFPHPSGRNRAERRKADRSRGVGITRRPSSKRLPARKMCRRINTGEQDWVEVQRRTIDLNFA